MCPQHPNWSESYTNYVISYSIWSAYNALLCHLLVASVHNYCIIYAIIMHIRQVILFNIKEVNYNQYIFLYFNPLDLFLHTLQYLQSLHRNVVGKECSEY